MNDVFRVYEKLWRRAQGEGASVCYAGWPSNEEAGSFHPTYYPKPTITVVRPSYMRPLDEPSRERNGLPPLTDPELHEELITLAHEYGHFKSAERTERAEYARYRASVERFDAAREETRARKPEELSQQEWNDRLRAALYNALDDEDRARILQEEALAWEIGRKSLVDLEFDDLTQYDERTKMGLHNYRYRLGMENAWPGDVLITDSGMCRA